jgi:hypothetical protein
MVMVMIRTNGLLAKKHKQILENMQGFDTDDDQLPGQEESPRQDSQHCEVLNKENVILGKAVNQVKRLEYEILDEEPHP